MELFSKESSILDVQLCSKYASVYEGFFAASKKFLWRPLRDQL